jgi:hypothetical protein
MLVVLGNFKKLKTQKKRIIVQYVKSRHFTMTEVVKPCEGGSSKQITSIKLIFLCFSHIKKLAF